MARRGYRFEETLVISREFEAWAVAQAPVIGPEEVRVKHVISENLLPEAHAGQGLQSIEERDG